MPIDFIGTRVCLYNIMICKNGKTIGMCPYVLLAVTGTTCCCLNVYCLWCISMWILYGYICVSVEYCYINTLPLFQSSNGDTPLTHLVFLMPLSLSRGCCIFFQYLTGSY